jgi:hypothetical protein
MLQRSWASRRTLGNASNGGTSKTLAEAPIDTPETIEQFVEQVCKTSKTEDALLQKVCAFRAAPP